MDLEEETLNALDVAAKASLKLQRIYVYARPDQCDHFDMAGAMDAQHARDLAILEYKRCRLVNEGVDDPERVLREIRDRMVNMSIEQIDSIISG